MLQGHQLLVVYDGGCGFCSNVAARIARLDWRHALRWLPGQTPGLAELLELSEQDLGAAAWALSPHGALHRGAAAMLAVIDALLPGGPPIFATLYRLPVLRQLFDAAYGAIAARRHRLPGTPYCSARPPAPLDDAERWEIERRVGWDAL